MINNLIMTNFYLELTFYQTKSVFCVLDVLLFFLFEFKVIMITFEKFQLIIYLLYLLNKILSLYLEENEKSSK